MPLGLGGKFQRASQKIARAGRPRTGKGLLVGSGPATPTWTGPEGRLLAPVALRIRWLPSRAYGQAERYTARRGLCGLFSTETLTN
jgi:hypothetical protein